MSAVSLNIQRSHHNFHQVKLYAVVHLAWKKEVCLAGQLLIIFSE